VGIANAAMDISDGLSSDLKHLCKASGFGAQIFDYDLPVSGAVGNILERNGLYKNRLWNGGDDYELLFTVPEKNTAKLEKIGKELNIPITKIGHMTKIKSVVMLDNNWKKIPFNQEGYRHF
jgi:thiamine-monophosphate kinase